MNQFERRKSKKPKPTPEKRKVNYGRVRVTIDFEPREEPVIKVYKGSHGNDFLTEGLE